MVAYMMYLWIHSTTRYIFRFTTFSETENSLGILGEVFSQSKVLMPLPFPGSNEVSNSEPSMWTLCQTALLLISLPAKVIFMRSADCVIMLFCCVILLTMHGYYQAISSTNNKKLCSKVGHIDYYIDKECLDKQEMVIFMQK